MELLRLVRVLTLGFSALVFGGQLINCADSVQRTVANKPISLRDALDFLVKLNGSDIKAKVLEHVESSLHTYLTLDDNRRTDGKIVFEKVLDNASNLRNNLLRSNSGYPDSWDRMDFSAASVNQHATRLVNWLPILHSEMWYLYFQISAECMTLGGNRWQLVGKDMNPNMKSWLTSQKPSRIPVISKDFKEQDFRTDLNLANIALYTGINLHLGGPLNHAQYGLLFLRPRWIDSNLASAFLFLEEFCKAVKSGTFSKHVSRPEHAGLTTTCGEITENLKPFKENLWALFSPISLEDVQEEEDGKTNARGSPSPNMYDGKLLADAFPNYMKWLVKNIPEITKSVDEMTKTSWNTEELANGTMAGPFKYGFVCKSECNDDIYRKLHDKSPKLKESLNKILEYRKSQQTSQYNEDSEPGETEEGDEVDSDPQGPQASKKGQKGEEPVSPPVPAPKKEPAAAEKPSAVPPVVPPQQPDTAGGSDPSPTGPPTSPETPTPQSNNNSNGPASNQVRDDSQQHPSAKAPGHKDSEPTSDSKAPVPDKEGETRGKTPSPDDSDDDDSELTDDYTDSSDGGSSNPPTPPAPEHNLRHPDDSTPAPKKPSFALVPTVRGLAMVGFLVAIC